MAPVVRSRATTLYTTPCPGVVSYVTFFGSWNNKCADYNGTQMKSLLYMFTIDKVFIQMYCSQNTKNTIVKISPLRNVNSEVTLF